LDLGKSENPKRRHRVRYAIFREGIRVCPACLKPIEENRYANGVSKGTGWRHKKVK
jgi:hypothetical protein